MTRFAAVDDLGHRCSPSESREEVDRWAAAQSAQGRSVRVYAHRLLKANQFSPQHPANCELVGMWEPLTETEKSELRRRHEHQVLFAKAEKRFARNYFPATLEKVDWKSVVEEINK